MASGSRLSWWFYAVRAARRHIKNYWLLLLLSILRSQGVFKARDDSVSSPVDARSLLRFLARLERLWPEELQDEIIPFLQNFILIPVSTNPPIKMKIPMKNGFWSCNIFRRFKNLRKEYPVSVESRKILDVGAYIGDTPICWVLKGAKIVYAVEPVPEHYQLLSFEVIKIDYEGCEHYILDQIIACKGREISRKSHNHLKAKRCHNDDVGI